MNALEIDHISFSYQKHLALNDVSLKVGVGERFALVGPNGGGKSTLFKLIATLFIPESGRISVFGSDSVAQAHVVRKSLGVLFQAPALDKKLSVEENMQCHGALYGLRGAVLRRKIEECLNQLGLSDRAQQRVEELSGGFKRRVEIAKTLLSSPKLLLLDEPTTGLDPLIRRELWEYLDIVNLEMKTTLVVTTHMMDEAERCGRIGFLNEGKLLATGTPSELREKIRGDVLVMSGKSLVSLKAKAESQFALKWQEADGELRAHSHEGRVLMPKILEALGSEIEAMTLRRPSLDDVFVDLCRGSTV